MERLHAAVENLAAEFDKLTSEVQENVARTAESSRAQSLASLEQSQTSGTLLQAEQAQTQLKDALDGHRQFTQQLAQLEQIHLISEDLKDVVRALEKRQKQ